MTQFFLVFGELALEGGGASVPGNVEATKASLEPEFGLLL